MATRWPCASSCSRAWLEDTVSSSMVIWHCCPRPTTSARPPPSEKLFPPPVDCSDIADVLPQCLNWLPWAASRVNPRGDGLPRGVVNRLTTLLRPPSEAPLRSAKTRAASASAALMPSTSGTIMLLVPAASAVRHGVRTAAYSMPVSRRMRTTSLAWMEKKSPCEFNATSVLTPMTLAHLSNSGPPLLPGLMAALCCTVRALS